MKNCTGCKWAQWERTKAGKLHPSGRGMCQKIIEIPALPAAFFWPGYNGIGVPSPRGGYINRRRDHNDHCPYYEAV
jgi:hypothetical protein